MSIISKELSDDKIKENPSLFEIAVAVFYLSQYKRLEGYFVQKSKNICSRDEFIRKSRIKYPQMSDEELFNFIRIYLLYEPAENNYEKRDFLFDGRLPRNRICWMGLYLQGKGDYKYCWLIEKTGEGMHHP